MVTINFICVGKLSEKYLQLALQEYEKRLGAYCKIHVYEVSEGKVFHEDSQAEIDACLEEEAKRIKKYLHKGFHIMMCIEGQQMSSQGLADFMQKNMVSGESIFNFVIGSSYGLAPSIKEMAKLQLSISKMTFPHQLFRIVLLEQVYRAFKMNANERYHK